MNEEVRGSVVYGSDGGMPSVHSRLPSSLAQHPTLPCSISLGILRRVGAGRGLSLARCPSSTRDSRLSISVPCLLPRERFLRWDYEGRPLGVSAPRAGLLQSAVLKAARYGASSNNYR